MQDFATDSSVTGPGPRGEAVDRISSPVTAWTLELLGAAEGVEVPDRVARALDGGLAVQVPGTVHTDLLGAGLIRDITVDGVESDDLWIARARWVYRTTVESPPAPFTRAVIGFEGIDTVGEISLNGRPRLRVQNMFRTHEIDITTELRAGPVTVAVELDSALAVAEAAEAVNPLPRPDIYPMPYNQVRKMACSFGWDWGPATVTAGLWKPVSLTTWTTARLKGVQVSARAGDTPSLSLRARCLGTAEALRVRLSGPVGDRDAGAELERTELERTVAVTGSAVELDLPVPGARRWNPVGHGSQSLYDVEIDLLNDSGRVLDRQVRRVGFRDVQLVQTPQATGVSCELHVNGHRIWVRGLNWIPDDPFPHRIGRERLRTRIEQAVATGANLLRVWGGGVFESEDFYDICDELGVLVWQDFLFACAAYPQDATTVAEVTAEAEDNVLRLRHRASLAVWAGCNENLWAYHDWGWQEDLAGRPWGLLYYTQILPDIVSRLDGTRPYVPGSPFSPGSRHPNDPSAGSMHIWDVWNDRDWPAYAEHTPRFAAEFGWQASANWPTISRGVGGPEHVAVADPALELHQKAGDGTDKLARGLAWHLPFPPTRGVEWVYATQCVQAGAVRFGISHLRSQHDVCSGAIWWQHNDLWPAISWSLVDVAGRRKLAWYALREVFAPRAALLTGGRPDATVTLVNDTPDEWTAEVRIRVLDAGGSGLAEVTRPRTVPARGHVRLPLGDVLPEGALGQTAGGQLVTAQVGTARSTLWLTGDPQVKLPEHRLVVDRVVPVDGGVDVEVVAGTLLRDLSLMADVEVAEAEVDRQLLTLLPQERATFRVTGTGVSQVPAERWSELFFSQAALLR
ncbi:MAG: beta-mannosidase [Actinomycetota bacterium]|nr:beta-mannosidase [Actinomycetota bacterium]